MLTTFACLAVLLSPRQTNTQNDFPDTPKNHWVYEMASELKSLGFLVGYPDGLGREMPKWRSKYQFAVAFHAVAANVADFEKAIDGLARRPKGDPDAVAARKAFLSFGSSPWLSGVARNMLKIPVEFAHEYQTLGVANAAMIFSNCSATLIKLASGKGIPEVGEYTVQFKDVPKGHWAAAALLELRQAGILDGYPDGAFRG